MAASSNGLRSADAGSRSRSSIEPYVPVVTTDGHEPVDGPRSYPRSLAVAGCLWLIAALAACSPAAPSPTTAPTIATHTIQGTLDLNTAQIEQYGGFGSTRCRGLRGFDDLTEGAPVTVRDEAGVIIATSSLAVSKRDGNTRCTFNFAVPTVPDASFYSIEVSHRGELTYSFAEMESMGWSVAFSVGD